jgi:hypothetical protein
VTQKEVGTVTEVGNEATGWGKQLRPTTVALLLSADPLGLPPLARNKKLDAAPLT